MHTLYICYFGLREPLVQTQVLPYLRELRRDRVIVSLLTFEPHRRREWPRSQEREWQARLNADGIRWFMLSYHKKPSALVTPYDILRGAWTVAWLARRHEIDVLHARGHLPMAMALIAKRWTKCRLLFDLRGLLADEYAEAGVWTKDSWRFRAVRAIERAGLRRSDQVIVLTRRLRNWLVEHGLTHPDQIEVVPCCVDFGRFKDEQNNDVVSNSVKESQSFGANSKPTSRFEVVSAGSVTGLYLLDEMARFFLALKKERSDAFLRVLTMSSPEDVATRLQRVGVSPKDFWIGAVKPKEVPSYLRRARLGLSFRKATFSQIAASPTKIPEYLAAGLPLVCNAGVGDTEGLLTNERVGIIIRDFGEQSFRDAARAALTLTKDHQVSARCVETAHRYFDLQSVGGVGYRNAYRRLCEKATGTSSYSNS